MRQKIKMIKMIKYWLCLVCLFVLLLFAACAQVSDGDDAAIPGPDAAEEPAPDAEDAWPDAAPPPAGDSEAAASKTDRVFGSKAALTLEVTDQAGIAAELSFLAADFAGRTDYALGVTEIQGLVYDYEEYQTAEGSVQFCFSGENLLFVIVIKDNVAEVYQVEKIL